VCATAAFATEAVPTDWSRSASTATAHANVQRRIGCNSGVLMYTPMYIFEAQIAHA
jgi:hypothetical protein